jgi:hypothetical protein
MIVSFKGPGSGVDKTPTRKPQTPEKLKNTRRKPDG